MIQGEVESVLSYLRGFALCLNKNSHFRSRLAQTTHTPCTYRLRLSEPGADAWSQRSFLRAHDDTGVKILVMSPGHPGRSIGRMKSARVLFGLVLVNTSVHNVAGSRASDSMDPPEIEEETAGRSALSGVVGVTLHQLTESGAGNETRIARPSRWNEQDVPVPVAQEIDEWMRQNTVAREAVQTIERPLLVLDLNDGPLNSDSGDTNEDLTPDDIPPMENFVDLEETPELQVIHTHLNSESEPEVETSSSACQEEGAPGPVPVPVPPGPNNELEDQESDASDGETEVAPETVLIPAAPASGPPLIHLIAPLAEAPRAVPVPEEATAAALIPDPPVSGPQPYQLNTPLDGTLEAAPLLASPASSSESETELEVPLVEAAPTAVAAPVAQASLADLQSQEESLRRRIQELEVLNEVLRAQYLRLVQALRQFHAASAENAQRRAMLERQRDQQEAERVAALRTGNQTLHDQLGRRHVPGSLRDRIELWNRLVAERIRHHEEITALTRIFRNEQVENRRLRAESHSQGQQIRMLTENQRLSEVAREAECRQLRIRIEELMAELERAREQREPAPQPPAEQVPPVPQTVPEQRERSPTREEQANPETQARQDQFLECEQNECYNSEDGAVDSADQSSQQLQAQLAEARSIIVRLRQGHASLRDGSDTDHEHSSSCENIEALKKRFTQELNKQVQAEHNRMMNHCGRVGIANVAALASSALLFSSGAGLLGYALVCLRRCAMIAV